MGDCFASNLPSSPPITPNHNTNTNVLKILRNEKYSLYFSSYSQCPVWFSYTSLMQPSYPITNGNFTVLNGTFCIIHKIILFLRRTELKEHLVQVFCYRTLQSTQMLKILDLPQGLAILKSIYFQQCLSFAFTIDLQYIKDPLYAINNHFSPVRGFVHVFSLNNM